MFQHIVVCFSASTIFTAAAPSKGSVHRLWILHSGLHTAEFSKVTSDNISNVHWNLFCCIFRLFKSWQNCDVSLIHHHGEKTECFLMLFNYAVNLWEYTGKNRGRECVTTQWWWGFLDTGEMK
jgi:hypothetical protein